MAGSVLKGARTDCRGGDRLSMGVGHGRNPRDDWVRMSSMVGEGSLLDCMLDMGQCDLRVAHLRVLLGVVGNSSTGESNESRWDVLLKDGGCHMGCSCRSSTPSLRRLVEDSVC